MADKKRKSPLPKKYLKLGLVDGWKAYKKTAEYKKKKKAAEKKLKTVVKNPKKKIKKKVKKKTKSKARNKTTTTITSKKVIKKNPVPFITVARHELSFWD